jgi:hypothetical protein
LNVATKKFNNPKNTPDLSTREMIGLKLFETLALSNPYLASRILVSLKKDTYRDYMAEEFAKVIPPQLKNNVIGLYQEEIDKKISQLMNEDLKPEAIPEQKIVETMIYLISLNPLKAIEFLNTLERTDQVNVLIQLGQDYYPKTSAILHETNDEKERNELFLSIAGKDEKAAGRILAHMKDGVASGTKADKMFRHLSDQNEILATKILAYLQRDDNRSYMAEILSNSTK